MVNISNNGFIYVHRGDTFQIPLFINKGDIEEPLRFYIANHPKAEVFLGVMEPNQSFEKALIKKRFTSSSNVNQYGDLIVDFKSTDTERLIPGLYYYAIKAEIGSYNHNVNCEISEIESPSILVYGWQDESRDITQEDLKKLLPHLNLDLPAEMILVDSKTKQFKKVYAGQDDRDYLQVYEKLDIKGKLSNYLFEIPLIEFTENLTTKLNNVVVDTLKPSTEFLIME